MMQRSNLYYYSQRYFHLIVSDNNSNGRKDSSIFELIKSIIKRESASYPDSLLIPVSPPFCTPFRNTPPSISSISSVSSFYNFPQNTLSISSRYVIIFVGNAL